MKGYKKIDAIKSLDFVAHRLLRIVAEGMFEWNGDLFFCPFIKLEGKKIFSLNIWTEEIQNHRWAPVFRTEKDILLAGDPVNPELYKQKRLHKMDRVLLIDSNSQVFQKERMMIIKNGNKIDTLKFIAKLSDAQRSLLFPKEGYGQSIRQLMCDAARGKVTMLDQGEIERRWKEYIDQNNVKVA